MPRILGVDIPSGKRIEYALRYIYGIGPFRANRIVSLSGLDPSARSNDLSEQELNVLSELIIKNGYLIEGDLRQEVSLRIKSLQSINCYRGIRHKKGLPVRGQRTKTNARTRKGAKKGPVAVNKK